MILKCSSNIGHTALLSSVRFSMHVNDCRMTNIVMLTDVMSEIVLKGWRYGNKMY